MDDGKVGIVGALLKWYLRQGFDEAYGGGGGDGDGDGDVFFYILKVGVDVGVG